MRRKLYKGSWYAVWTEDGRTRRVALRTKDRATAEQRLADLQRQPVGDTVDAIYSEYVKELAAKGKDAPRAKEAWKALERLFGALRPDQVTKSLCRAYAIERRRYGRSDGTIAKELSCLRAALRWQNRHTPADIEQPRRPPPRERRLARAEYRRLRLAAKAGGLHLYVFVVLGVATAGRKQALLDLTWDRVDFGRGEIRLAHGQGGKGRATVPMTRHARRVLRLAHRARETVFVVEYAGRPVGSVKRAFASACQRAGLPGVTPHVLRHTAAVWMAEAGVPMDEIAQYLGHSDPRITYRVYARYSPSYLRRAAAALE
jgi:integrase